MSQTTDALNQMAEALDSALDVINNLFAAEATDRTQLTDANTQIDALKAQLVDATKNDSDAATTISSLTDKLKAVAEKAHAATPPPVDPTAPVVPATPPATPATAPTAS